MPLIRIRDIAREETDNLYAGDYADEYVVGTNDILVGMDGDFNVSKWPGKKGLLNQRVCRLTLHSKYYDKEFYYYCLQPYLDAINAETSAVTVKHLSSKTIKSIPLPLPPLPEQRAIVSKLEQLFSELEDGVANLQKAQRQLKVYRQAVLKKAFEGELTREWRAQQTGLPTAEELLEQIQAERERYYEQQLAEWKQAVADWEADGKVGKKPRKPGKLSRFNSPQRQLKLKLPQAWCFELLGNLSSGVEYGSSSKSKEEGMIPVLRMGNMQNGKIDWNDLKYTSDEEEIDRYRLIKGDVLFNRTNSPELVGKTVIYKGEREAIFAGYLIRINHFKKVLSGDYLNYFLNSHPAKVYGNFVKTDGVNQSNINGKKLSNYPIPFCSLPEQHQIVQEIESRLSVCDQLEKDIEANLRRAERLRQSLLQKAFAGELLTEAELQACRAAPDWEPAERLLERIKGEKNRKANTL